MKHKPSRFGSGYTLLECLVVIFITALIGYITIPSMQELWARQQAESFMHQLRQHIDLARVKAVSENQIISICPQQDNHCNADWQSHQIAIFSGDPSKFGKIWRVIDSPPASHILSYNRDLLQFRADGSLNGFQNGTFLYCVKNYDWHLTLSYSQAGRSQQTLESTPCV